MTLRITKITVHGCKNCGESQVMSFNTVGAPVSADREMTPQEIWDHYNGPGVVEDDPEIEVPMPCPIHGKNVFAPKP